MEVLAAAVQDAVEGVTRDLALHGEGQVAGHRATGGGGVEVETDGGVEVDLDAAAARADVAAVGGAGGEADLARSAGRGCLDPPAGAADRHSAAARAGAHAAGHLLE